MVRTLFCLLMLSAPALAWEVEAGVDCVVRHVGDSASVLLTYQPLTGQYSIAITTEKPWTDSAVFAMRFDGPRYNTIRTSRHVITNDGTTLTVTDSGFGNVLDGLEYNHIAMAVTGNQAVVMPLAGAAPAIQAFRACADSQAI